MSAKRSGKASPPIAPEGAAGSAAWAFGRVVPRTIASQPASVGFPGR